MTTYIILGALVWIACGIAACGLCFAHFQRKYLMLRLRDFYSDRSFAMFWFAGGPLSLFVSLTTGGHLGHGWLWPWSSKAVTEALESA